MHVVADYRPVPTLADERDIGLAFRYDELLLIIYAVLDIDDKSLPGAVRGRIDGRLKRGVIPAAVYGDHKIGRNFRIVR